MAPNPAVPAGCAWLVLTLATIAIATTSRGPAASPSAACSSATQACTVAELESVCTSQTWEDASTQFIPAHDSSSRDRREPLRSGPATVTCPLPTSRITASSNWRSCCTIGSALDVIGPLSCTVFGSANGAGIQFLDGPCVGWYEDLNISSLPDQCITYLAKLNQLELTFPPLVDADVWTVLPSLVNISSLTISGGVVQLETAGWTGSQISTLDLSNNALGVLLPNAWDMLPNLRTMDLSGNNMYAFSPTMFQSSTLLLNLDLSNNALQRLPPWTAQQHALISLELAHNYLTTLSADVLPAAPDLRSITLHHNNLASLEPDTFAHMLQIQRLDLSYNALTAISLEWFAHQQELNQIDLSFNAITSLPNVGLTNTALTSMALTDNSLTILPPLLLAKLNLNVLALDNNQLTVLPDTLTALSLNTFSAANNLLTTLPNGFFSSNNLQELSLNNNRIASLDNAVHSGSATINAIPLLDVSHNLLTTIPPALLGSASNIVKLNDNRLTELHPSSTPDSMTSLDVSENALTTLDERLWSAQSMLQFANLGFNQITHLPALPTSCSLAMLSLNDNPLQGWPAGLDNCSLVQLNISNTHLTLTQRQAAILANVNNLQAFNIDVDMNVISAMPFLDSLVLGGTFLCPRGGVLHLELPPTVTYLALTDTKCEVISIDAPGLRDLDLSGNSDMYEATVKGPNLITTVQLLRCNSLTQLNMPAIAELSLSDFPAGFTDALCLYQGSSILRLQAMQANTSTMDAFSKLLLRCGEVVGQLDLSNNPWLDDVEIFRAALQRPYVVNADTNLLGPDGQVHLTFQATAVMNRPSALQLYLAGLPVQCLTRGHFATARLLNGNSQPVAIHQYECSCAPGYAQSGTRCVSKTPFLATAAGVVTVVASTLAVTACLMALVLYGRRYMNLRGELHEAYDDLDIHQQLLAEKEDEVVRLKKAWEIEASELDLDGRLDLESPGASGEVHSGTWGNVRVAVKVLRASLAQFDERSREEFESEVAFLQKTRHPNLVRFFGAGTLSSGCPFLVLELVELGSYQKFLRNSLGPDLDFAIRLRILVDVCRGVGFLHSLGLIHRDLKPAISSTGLYAAHLHRFFLVMDDVGNILIDRIRGDLIAKVTDFGTLRTLMDTSMPMAERRAELKRQRQAARGDHSNTSSGIDAIDLSRSGGALSQASAAPSDPASSRTLTAAVGTPLYCAPEVLRGDEYHLPADMYSFGVTMWETATRALPDLLALTYGDQTPSGPFLSTLLRTIEEGHQLILDPEMDVPDGYADLMERCLQRDPALRPTCEETRHTLERLVAALHPEDDVEV
ncbi:uncharacterized protein MONBRDRAFT_36839 [Monosiga brevicollis MX1]|uniref:Protein kinase domain-containing protein n=1 Tax=Monosiga brevicollis TaxID=81824 RepID=A9UY35_MONBE|nr:uncharacterized protein MONBRDRAFT_36839 [Monosiga brevicollis MX1]EDQ89951.1 predicted protein [Monosiga brevicollis MX1]|eukprot:XP_001745373.1 hypothetical protein [Monosiga brevicollis MX1]